MKQTEANLLTTLVDRSLRKGELEYLVNRSFDGSSLNFQKLRTFWIQY